MADQRPSGQIEGQWYITERAVDDYVRLMRLRQLDAEMATDELIVLSRAAHHVRSQDNGLELWRVKAPNGFRIRCLVGDSGVAGGKPALVRVLGEHGGVKRQR